MADDVDTDEALLERVKAGDEAAFQELFARHAGRLERQCRGRMSPAVRRKVSVADVLQETRIVALQKCDGFEDRGPGSVARWLRRIAEMKAREAVRRHAGRQKRAVGREVTRAQRAETGAFAAGLPSPSHAAMAKESQNRVAKVLATLSGDHRLILTLVRQQGLSLGEAGDRMGRTREAAKKLYARALRSFAAALEREASRE